jgi:predicted nucleic acid-binding Zn ribbon protein
MGTGSGVIFKGSGFYLTDYRKDQGKKSDKPAEKKETPKGNSSTPDTTKKD